MAVPRLTSATNWVIWLNTITDDMFWTICGCLCLWITLFLYLKERFGMGLSLVGSTWGVTFVVFLMYWLGLVSQTLVFIFALASAISLVVM